MLDPALCVVSCSNPSPGLWPGQLHGHSVLLQLYHPAETPHAIPLATACGSKGKCLVKGMLDGINITRLLTSYSSQGSYCEEVSAWHYTVVLSSQTNWEVTCFLSSFFKNSLSPPHAEAHENGHDNVLTFL